MTAGISFRGWRDGDTSRRMPLRIFVLCLQRITTADNGLMNDSGAGELTISIMIDMTDSFGRSFRMAIYLS